MATTLTDSLCTRCGLCCDGSLLAEVELERDAEATRAIALGLRVDEESDEPVMMLPCSGLCGTRCSVYAHRPRTCRTYECRLLIEARAGQVSVSEALEVIEEARDRVAAVRQLLASRPQDDATLPLHERCDEALSDSAGRSARTRMNQSMLESEIADMRDLLESRFLGDGRRRPVGSNR